MNRVMLALAASVGVAAAFAQDVGESNPEEVQRKVVGKAKVAFSTLPQCHSVVGSVQVCKAGKSDEWVDVEDGKYYPLGSSFRTLSDGKLVLDFGADVKVTILGNSSFRTKCQKLGDSTRTVYPCCGELQFDLPDTMPEGTFTVALPGFCINNLAGSSKVIRMDKGDGDRVTVRCVTGSLSIAGRHFGIATMRAADEVVIRSSHDYLVSELLGTSGDYAVKLNRGTVFRDEIDDNGSIKKVTSTCDSEWRLSPKTRVVISRAKAAIGDKMSVHIMAFDAAGERKSECYFCENRPEMNSGELVAKEKTNREELAKQAAESTETTAAEDAEESSDEDTNNNENSDEEE